MKHAPLALFTLAVAAVAAWPLMHRGAPSAATAPGEVALRPACTPPPPEETPPGPHALVLPPGHPPIDLRGLLPPGHPPIASDEGLDALPPGHPELPPGHPPIPSSPRGMPLTFEEPVIHEI